MSDNSQQATGIADEHKEGMLEPLSRRPIPDVIAERLTVAVANGTLRPGDKLPSEPELSRQLGVGRTSLREALRQLHTFGVVKSVRGRGTYVCEPPGDNPTMQFLEWSTNHKSVVSELLESRMALETTAAALAAVRAQDVVVAQLEKLAGKHDDAMRREDVDDLVASDEQFHQALVEASGNTYMRRLYAVLVPELNEFRRRTLPLSGVSQRSVRDHDAILSAVREKDPKRARETVVRHVWTLYQEVRTASDETPPPSSLAEQDDIFL